MLTAPEKELIKRLLTFVNLKKIKSTKQVEKIFSNVQGLTGRLAPYDPREVKTCVQEQASLRDVLTKIASRRKKDLEEAIAKIDSMTVARVQGAIGLSPDGRLILKAGLFGVQAAAWYAAALIVDLSRGLRNRLGECGAPGCGRFNISLDLRGRPLRHCNEEHRRLADAKPSQLRSERRRKEEKAKRLFQQGETVDYVRGRLADGRAHFTKEQLERLAEKARRRRAP